MPEAASIPRRKFSIVPLEDRFAPGCLLWNGGFLGDDIDAVAAAFSAEAAPSRSLQVESRVPASIVTAVDDNAVALPQPSTPLDVPREAPLAPAAQQQPDSLPASFGPQIDELLGGVDRELNTKIDVPDDRANQLLEVIEHRFSVQPLGRTDQPTSVVNALLDQVDHEIDQELRTENARRNS